METVCTIETVFMKCVNLSINAGYLIFVVLLLRPVLRKAPRQIICLLWILAGLRLICPFSFNSPFSLIPSAETIPATIVLSPSPSIDSGIPPVDAQINPVISAALGPAPGDSVNPLQILTYLASRIWLAGMTAMVCCLAGSFLRLHLKMRTATLLRDNIRQSEFVDSPFILGIVRPQIYVPYHMSDEVLAHVLTHEQAHLARKDHLLKPFAFLILSVYWFHPLVWAGYLLFCKDMELACDEKVIRNLDDARRKSYSLSLLSCTALPVRHGAINACPLAFGEISVRERILRIKSYRRPAPGLVIAAVSLCAVTALCFLTNPTPHDEPETRDNPELQTPLASDAPIHDTASSEETPDDDAPDASSEGNMPDSASERVPPLPDVYSTSGTNLSQDEARAITDAILAYNRSGSLPRDVLPCCSFTLLGSLSSTPVYGSRTHRVTYYGWALYKELAVSDEGIRDMGGSHIPVALTFELGNDRHEFLPMQSVPQSVYREDAGYVLTEYWTPGDGSYYVEDIRKHFPSFIQEDALDSQKYILPQTQACYRQAILAGGLGTEQIDGILDALLDTISQPTISSAVQDYIDAHDIEYRELLFYGDCTLDYSERHPGQNLRGQILLRACEDIRNTRNLIAQPD